MRTFSDLDALWAQRHQASDLNAFEQELRAARNAAPNAADLLWRHARTLHFRAMQSEESDDHAEAARLFREGQDRAEKALQTQPINVPSLFWAASCGLEAARARSPLAALRVLPLARQRLQKAVEIDAAWHYAGPLRVLGRIAHQTPHLLGGDTRRALPLYERALQLAPSHPTTMLYLAEALVDSGRHDEARDHLNEILAAPFFFDWHWEQERDRHRARSLLARLSKP